MAFGNYGNYNAFQPGGFQQPQPYYAPSTQPIMQYQPPAQPQQAPASPLWVQGEAGAKAYPVAAGNSVLLMDSERNVFYIKSADASGMPMLRTFDYTERTAAQNPPVQAAQMPSGDFVTRSEFDALRARIEALTMPVPTTVVKEEEAHAQRTV